MYPYQRTPMGNPYISPIYPYNTWVFMGYYPQESLYKPYKYHGYTVRGTPNCPLNIWDYITQVSGPLTPSHLSNEKRAPGWL